MRTLPIIGLAMAVAIVSSGATVFLFKSDFFAGIAFKERWVPSESETVAQKPAVFAALVVVDGSRGVLTFEEQQSLFNGFADRLDDPVSAQIRKLVRSKTKDLIVCGEINAKNRFGGYVGFIPFSAGVFPQKALVSMPTKEVAEQMPAQVRAQMTNIGCSGI
jgi:hypothetical protein